MIQCERGHFYDENRYSGCPYCSQVSVAPRSVTPPVAPNMEIPTPSCGKTVAVEGVETAPSVGKTVAIDMPVEQFAPVNKTVAIQEEPLLDFPPVTPIAPPQAPAVPVAASVPAVAAAPVAAQAPAVPQAAPAPAPDVPQAAPAPSVPVAAPAPAAPSYAADMNASIPYNGVSETPERILTEQISIDLPVTGLGVSDNPQPIPQEEKFYQSSPDRPYAVTGLGVKENPTPIPNDVGATFPIPSEGNSASAAQPGQAEAAAFAAFGFPGGPIPGMVPGAPMPGAPVAQTAPSEPQAPEAVEEKTPETAVEVATPEIPTEEKAPEAPVKAPVPSFPSEENVPEIPVDAPSPVIEEPKPADPNATVALTESDMDFIPRVHARAFLVGIDGPMTGASYVFQESRAIIGRQKNYEISLYRDNSVSRSPHAILTYNKDTLRYAIACGDADKKVSVNGAFITGETELKLYDVIGVGQSRLLFIPVCSEKFAW